MRKPPPLPQQLPGLLFARALTAKTLRRSSGEETDFLANPSPEAPQGPEQALIQPPGRGGDLPSLLRPRGSGEDSRSPGVGCAAAELSPARGGLLLPVLANCPAVVGALCGIISKIKVYI